MREKDEHAGFIVILSSTRVCLNTCNALTTKPESVGSVSVGGVRRVDTALDLDVQENCKKKNLKKSCLDEWEERTCSCHAAVADVDRHCLTDKRGEKRKKGEEWG
jgi:hypothetical protein